MPGEVRGEGSVIGGHARRASRAVGTALGLPWASAWAGTAVMIALIVVTALLLGECIAAGSAIPSLSRRGGSRCSTNPNFLILLAVHPSGGRAGARTFDDRNLQRREIRFKDMQLLV